MVEREEIDTVLGRQVTELRVKLGWPLKTLASHLGVSVQQVQKYEKGFNKISASLLYEIARIFKVDVSFFYNLLGGSENYKKILRMFLIESCEETSFLFQKASSKYVDRLNIFTNGDSISALNFLKKSCALGSYLRPDVIVIGDQSSAIKALELLKQLKKLTGLSDIPVVIFSTNERDKYEKAYAFQAAGFINKSSDYKKLTKQIL